MILDEIAGRVRGASGCFLVFLNTAHDVSCSFRLFCVSSACEFDWKESGILGVETWVVGVAC